MRDKCDECKHLEVYSLDKPVCLKMGNKKIVGRLIPINGVHIITPYWCPGGEPYDRN